MWGDHDELEIFLEIRLIPSRIDQKLKNKEGKYMLFKEGNWAEDHGQLERSWRRFARVVGAVPLGEDMASIPR